MARRIAAMTLSVVLLASVTLIYPADPPVADAKVMPIAKEITLTPEDFIVKWEQEYNQIKAEVKHKAQRVEVSEKISFLLSGYAATKPRVIFNGHASIDAGAAFVAPATGKYEITFYDTLDIDKADVYVAKKKGKHRYGVYANAFAKVDYEVSGKENYWAEHGHDIENTVASDLVTQGKSFMDRNPKQAKKIVDGSVKATEVVIIAAATALECPACGKVIAEVAKPLVEKGVTSLLSKQKPKSTVTSFAGHFPRTTTLSVDLKEGELYAVSSRIIVGIDSYDGHSGYRTWATLEGSYKLEKVTIKLVSGPKIPDLNGSGRIDTGDATLILRMVIGVEPENLLGDVNQNGRIDTGDATLILKQLVGGVATLGPASIAPASLPGERRALTIDADTDQSVYFMGQDVLIQGNVLSDGGPVDRADLEVNVIDPFGEVIQDQLTHTLEDGTFSSVFELYRYAHSGEYKVKISASKPGYVGTDSMLSFKVLPT